MLSPQEIALNISTELKRKRLGVAEMCADCGLNKNALSTMRAGNMPRIESLCAIADYIGCSLDLLLNRSAGADTAEHAELMRQFDRLDNDSKEIIARLIVKLSERG